MNKENEDNDLLNRTNDLLEKSKNPEQYDINFLDEAGNITSKVTAALMDGNIETKIANKISKKCGKVLKNMKKHFEKNKSK